MARKPRIHFPGAVYHVIIRGNNQAPVLQSQKDKQKYLSIVWKYKQDYAFQLLLFVVMDNHAHMVIRVAETPLSRIMQLIQQSYARYYNYEYECSGHVFEGRYKAYLCDSNRYLLALVSYIHRNPVEAGLTATLEYEWSSHGYYTGKKKDSLVDREFIYRILSQDNALDPVQAYNKFINEKTPEPTCPVITENLEIHYPAADPLIEKIAAQNNIQKEQLFQKAKTHQVSTAKKELIRQLLQHGWPPKDISRLLKVSPPYISKVSRTK